MMVGSTNGWWCARLRLAGALTLLALASACPGDDASTDATASTTAASTGPDSTGGTTVVATDGTASTTAASTTADDTAGTASGTADSGSSDTGPTSCETDPTEELPAVLEVTLEILNDTAATVYVLASGNGCTEYEVIRDGWSLPLQLGFACGCECDSPPPPTAESVALDPGQSYSVTWDGRVLALYEERFACEQGCVTEANGSLQPLRPASVTMTLPIFSEAGIFQQGSAGGLEIRCESPLSFSVDFDLGTEDLTIPVLLSEAVIR